MKWKPAIVYVCPHCNELTSIQDKFCNECTQPVEYAGNYKLFKMQTTKSGINKIEAGDIVDVIFARKNIFDWQNNCILGDCKVIKIPYAVGDTYGFIYQDDEIQRNIFINPISIEFIGVEFIKRV
ncbi:MAG: hypothetical protein M1391_14620 [Bacteroidetes bacterium]|nr:hypothetical protein [Bacteroidota bacterium]MCL6099797.1 hypothetical protein [Bacteroidota bacterium]